MKIKPKKNKSKKKLSYMYGNFIYSKPSMKKSQDNLIDQANISLRKSFSDMENLVAKTYFLVENGEASRSELRKLYNFASKLEQMINDFKYSMMR